MILENQGGGASGEPPGAGDELGGGAGDGHRTQSNYLTQSNELNSSKEEQPKADTSNQEINELIGQIRKTCLDLNIIYDKDDDRKFARHILTAKYF